MTFPNFALHATPINRVASRVSFGESEAYAPKTNGACVSFDFPPIAIKARAKSSPDITGFRRGFMTAFRYHNSGKNGAQWLCRCDCGKYEVRNSGRWMKAVDVPDACVICATTFNRTNGHSMHETKESKARGIKAHLEKKLQEALL